MITLLESLHPPLIGRRVNVLVLDEFVEAADKVEQVLAAALGECREAIG
jgi:hypothetical protein